MAESQVRIFVSSPADLDHERALIKDIVDALGQEYLPYFQLHAVLWEEEALTAAQSFQAGLLQPSACEIVLVMLWTRLGTPLADDPYGGMTGTEWEFVDAVEGSTRAGQPEVLVYKKTTPRLIDITNAEATREAVADRERLEAFFRTHFYNPDGSFRRAFRQFDSDRALRELVEVQLRKLLNRRISVERGRRPGAGEWRDSPFRARAPFELADEPVFVGRETETRELVARLDAQRGGGRGLLLITGPSGVGKSSLVRAGLLPRLVRPYLFAGISGCRWALLACHRDDPLAALAETLLAPTLLGPALAGFGLDQAGLTRLLETEPAVAAGQVQAALTRVVDNASQRAGGLDGRQQLALILDPLDGLFSPAALAAPRTQTFAAALATLAAQDGVWIIATLRSDYLRLVPRVPALADLLDDQSWFRLEPPLAARIRQVIEIPARIAGIEYEGGVGGTGRGLVDLLEAEAGDLAQWPTLLSPVLNGLYERARVARSRSEVGNAHTVEARLTLRISDYHALGGLAGTTLGRAEALWEGLDAGARAALPTLCRALIALEGGPASHPFPRAGDLRALERDLAGARLVQALIDARLVVAAGVADPAEHRPCAQADNGLVNAFARLARETREEWRARLLPRRPNQALAASAAVPAAEITEAAADAPPARARWQDYRPTATLIHQVLIDTWEPVRVWLADPANRDDLQLRFQITRQARLWKRTDCNREYLLGEVGYAAARRFAAAYDSELEPLERDYLARSLANLRDQRRRNRWVRVTGLVLALLLVAASGAAYWAWQASRAATLNLHRSELNAADLAITEGNTPEAVRLALNAARDLPQAATDTLSRAFSANRLLAMIKVGGAAPGRPLSPSFSNNGRQLVTLSVQEGAGLWNLEDDRFVFERQLSAPGLPIHAVRFAIGGSQPLVLGMGETGVWQLATPDQAPAVIAAGTAPGWTCGLGPEGISTVDRDRRYLALSHPVPGGRFGVCVLDLARPGAPLWDRALHQREIRSIGFAPDGLRLLTASRDGTARVVDTVTGTELLTLPRTGPLDRPINRAIFDRQGERVAVAAADERVRLYDRTGREQQVLGEMMRDGRRIRIHKTAVRDLTFASDDRYLLAGDDEGQLVRWDLTTGTAEVLGQHRLSVERVRVSRAVDPRADEPLVLTASLDKTVRLWGLQSGRQAGVFSHDQAVSEARFSRDGRRVLTYSEQDGSARIWSVAPTTTLAFPLAHEDHVWHLALARPPKELDADPNAVLIATAAFDGVVQVWRYDASAPRAAPVAIWRLVGHQGRVRRVAFSPDGRRLASAAFDGSARVWDMITGGGCALVPEGGSQSAAPSDVQGARESASESADGTKPAPRIEFYQTLFAPDGRWLLTASNDRARPVRLWDPAACLELPLPAALEHDPNKVQAAAVAAGPGPAGSQLAATGSDTGTLRVARRAPEGTWGLQCRLDVHTAPITDLAFAPDGGSLASVSEDGRLALVTLTAVGCDDPRYLDGGTGTLYSVSYSPDGAALVTASQDARAQVWDLRGTLLADLKGHKDRVYSAEFSPDGRWILTASRDGTLRLWQRPEPLSAAGANPQARGAYLVMDGNLGGAAYARFSPDGHSVAAAYWENTALLWRVWTADPTPDRTLEAIWGKERSRLALIREAVRFRRDNGLDVPVAEEAADE